MSDSHVNDIRYTALWRPLVKPGARTGHLLPIVASASSFFSVGGPQNLPDAHTPSNLSPWLLGSERAEISGIANCGGGGLRRPATRRTPPRDETPRTTANSICSMENAHRMPRGLPATVSHPATCYTGCYGAGGTANKGGSVLQKG